MRRLLLFVLTFMAQTLPATESNPPVSAIAAPDAAAFTHHARAAETELREHILPFWLAHARDQKLGGFHGEIDNERGRTVFEVGFARAVRKVLGESTPKIP